MGRRRTSRAQRKRQKARLSSHQRELREAFATATRLAYANLLAGRRVSHEERKLLAGWVIPWWFMRMHNGGDDFRLADPMAPDEVLLSLPPMPGPSMYALERKGQVATRSTDLDLWEVVMYPA